MTVNIHAAKPRIVETRFKLRTNNDNVGFIQRYGIQRSLGYDRSAFLLAALLPRSHRAAAIGLLVVLVFFVAIVIVFAGDPKKRRSDDFTGERCVDLEVCTTFVLR